jgi:osmotically inducible protein OsmC
MATLYTAEVTVTGGRDGHARSSDGLLDVRLAVPKEMGGQGGATNPEQLFAAGYAACFESALMVSARRRHIDAGTVSITSRVGVGPSEGGQYALTVELRVSIPGAERSVAEDLVQEADKVCPYSNAVRGNIRVQLVVEASTNTP